MTASRAIRGTKVKLLFIFCVVFILAGIFTGVHNILVQLVELKESNAICHQQEENLSTQLQVISEYKQKLEKSIKAQKAEHDQKLIQLEDNLEKEKNKHEKHSADLKQKFDTLQQHFNLLQTSNDDLTESKIKLEEQVKELQEQVKSLNKQKENLKTKIISQQMETENWEKKYNENTFNKNESESKINHLTKVNYELQRELNGLKHKDTFNNLENFKPSEASFKASSNSNAAGESGKAVGNMPSQSGASSSPSSRNVLSPQSRSTTKSGMKSSVASINGARPIGIPTVTPETLKKHDILFEIPKQIYEMQKKKVPDGVAPIPESRDNMDLASNDATNNRYRIAVDGNEPDVKPKDMDIENGAHEEFDSPGQGKNIKLGDNDAGLSFNDETIKQSLKQNFEKQHIDNLAMHPKDEERPDYNDLQNDVPADENDPEDDDVQEDEFGAMLQHKEPAIRN